MNIAPTGFEWFRFAQPLPRLLLASQTQSPVACACRQTSETYQQKSHQKMGFSLVAPTGFEPVFSA